MRGHGYGLEAGDRHVEAAGDVGGARAVWRQTSLRNTIGPTIGADDDARVEVGGQLAARLGPLDDRAGSAAGARRRCGRAAARSRCRGRRPRSGTASAGRPCRSGRRATMPPKYASRSPRSEPVSGVRDVLERRAHGVDDQRRPLRPVAVDRRLGHARAGGDLLDRQARRRPRSTIRSIAAASALRRASSLLGRAIRHLVTVSGSTLARSLR